MGVPVYLNGAKQPAGWVGYDGQIYLEGLTADNALVLKDEHYECKTHFAFKAVPDALPEIGPLTCTPYPHTCRSRRHSGALPSRLLLASSGRRRPLKSRWTVALQCLAVWLLALSPGPASLRQYQQLCCAGPVG
ncbi:hypothetical protein CDEF62S_03256 [Castellaniella defragrans]